MQDQNTADNSIIHPNTDSSVYQDEDLRPIYEYKQALRNLSILLIEQDWSELKDDSSTIRTVEEQLRDIIKNLEELRRKPLRKKVEMEDILKALNHALKELYRAKDLAKEDTIRVISTLSIDKYDKIQLCRDYLDLALGLMPSRSEVTNSNSSDTNHPSNVAESDTLTG